MKLAKGDIIRWIWRTGDDPIESIYIVLDNEWKEPGLAGFFQVYVLAQFDQYEDARDRYGSILEMDYYSLHQKVQDGMVEKLFDAAQYVDIKLSEV